MKLGKLKILDQFIQNKNIMDLLPVLTKFVPIHIEGRPHLRDYVYTGYCEEFEELKEGEDIPFYTCVVTQVDNNTVVNFKNNAMKKKKLSKQEIEALRLKKLEMSGKLVKK